MTRNGCLFSAFLATSFLLSACSADPNAGSCTSNAQCPSGQQCVSDRCVVGTPAMDAGGVDARDSDGMDAGGDGGNVASDTGAMEDGARGDIVQDGPVCPAARACPSTCCAMDQRCAFGTCVRDLGTCMQDNECQSDSYCADGVCVPYGVPPARQTNPMCTRTISIDSLAPAVQCRWTGPPMGDAFMGHNQAMSTPIVADLDLDNDPTTLAPSIVFASFPTTSGTYNNPGILRIIDGRDCAHQQTFGEAGDAVVATASPAIADLNGDGRNEIVAVAMGGGLLMFRYDAGMTRYVRAWRSGTCAAGGMRTPDTLGAATWGGPAIHDLDDDGVPEIIHGGVVYDTNGCILDQAQGYQAYSHGVLPVIADVDSDGRMELVRANGIFEWNTMTRRWVAEPYFTVGSLSPGQVAVGELASVPLARLGGMDGPEVVVVASGTVRVQTLEGTVIFGPFPVPGGGVSGPPTIADFDGDGRAEFATAGGAQYVVFDLDCVPGGTATRCVQPTPRMDGVLWSRPSQDRSSNVTGSSVFDFDADGRAEAVYADECFLRVYEGGTGRVVYSAPRSSGTAYENPVIADVDGDYRSEIVSTVNDYAGALGCPATDPLFAASRFALNHGVVVLRDEMDRWAASRPIWNQHAYHVTHVGDLGEIQRSSLVRQNWRTPGLNNFRQNVQGSLAARGLPDLTVTADPGPLVLMCAGDRATLRARVCNRGTLPVGPGAAVLFREAPMGTSLCGATTSSMIAPGGCVNVSCDASLPARTIDVSISVNQDAMPLDECLRDNNRSTIRSVYCNTPG
ncbi:MAG: VCBS repeat-containing protein [Deltaproteobacteria bacterium]|nr:VCBS repeat-containing protein [Deltaproteobacteria bacterium]